MIQETEWKLKPARMVGPLDSANFIGREGQDVRTRNVRIHKGLEGNS